jgi:PTS system mannose-specific IIA component
LVGILLGSHGYFAKEALASAEMIVGNQENIASFSLEEQMDLEATILSAQESYQSLDKSSGVLILTDIQGGTPSNVAMVIQRKNENTYALAGFNLPLLIEALLNREKNVTNLVSYLEELFPATLSNLSK